MATRCASCGAALAVGVRTCLACGRDVSADRAPALVLPKMVEQPLWSRTKAGHRCAASVRATPWGPELRIAVDGELFWSRTYRHAAPHVFTAAVAAKEAEFEAEGWAAAGSGR